MIVTAIATKVLATKAMLVASLLGGGTVHVTITAPGHAPKVNAKWSYTVRVSEGGKPVAAKLTEQIVDPIGGAHPVQLGKTTTNITRRPIKGVFSDFIIWPASSRGVPLKLRVTVTVGTKRQVVEYAVTPRG